MQACPICSHDLQSFTRKEFSDSLCQHIDQAHAQGPCFVPSNVTRPWRCPLCSDHKRCFKTCATFTKHLVQAHSAGYAPRPQPPSQQWASSAPKAAAPAASTNHKLSLNLQLSGNATSIKTSDYEDTLTVPCLPWLPRPKWWSRPPAATLLLATWNLEHFSLNSADSAVAARKVANICTTLRELCAREGPSASVVVALQEVSCSRAVAFLAGYLTEKDAAGADGGSGRIWRGYTSERLGNNNERAAFLWSSPPTAAAAAAVPPAPLCLRWCGFGGDNSGATTNAPEAAAAAAARGLNGPGAAGPPGAAPTPGGGGGVGAWRGRQAPLHAAAPASFRLLAESDRQTVIRRREEAVSDGRYMRSPLYGLFRVGYCNVLVVNVHLAAEEAAARSELSSLHLLASAIHQPNDRLFRRHFSRLGCGSWGLVGRKPRGLMAIVGDFNCPTGRAVPVVPAVLQSSAKPGTAPGAPSAAAGPAGVPAAASAYDSGSGAPGEKGEGQQGGGGGSNRAGCKGGAAPGGGGKTANAASWEALRRHGWVNVLAACRLSDGAGSGSAVPVKGAGSGIQGTGTGFSAADAALSAGASSHAPVVATNWYAKEPKALDAICLKRDSSGGLDLVNGCGVCAPPPHVDAAAGAAKLYPNHLLCWVRLDLGRLQRAPGKVRGLGEPAPVAQGGAGGGAAAHAAVAKAAPASVDAAKMRKAGKAEKSGKPGAGGK